MTTFQLKFSSEDNMLHFQNTLCCCFCCAVCTYQVHIFFQMCEDMGFILVALGLTGALGQIFIFITIAKFGALTCSIIGLARKVTTLVASIWFYGHVLNATQVFGLLVCVGGMIVDFATKGKKSKGGGHGAGGHTKIEKAPPPVIYEDDHVDDDDELKHMLPKDTSRNSDNSSGDVELGPLTQKDEQ